MNVFKYIFLLLVKSCHLSNDVIETLAARIRAEWEGCSFPRLPEISTAASLAHHGLLRSVEEMWLYNVDLASVPAEHLASLAACVTVRVWIWNVSNTDLTGILGSSKSEWLVIRKQSLSTEETRALVQAMTNVEKVVLGDSGDVTLDISTLVTYDGQGKCKKVWICGDAADKYREEVKRLAQGISWAVDDGYGIVIRRE